MSHQPPVEANASLGDVVLHREASLRAQLVALLESGQNADGGWSFHAGGESRVEPTCWAIHGLHTSGEVEKQISRAVDFLKSKQLSDGSWPATGGMEYGCWVTSLACSALAYSSENEKTITAGLEWLCDDYPRDSSRWQKFLKNFQSDKNVVAHSDEFRGWGWTPRTASWVEPTSFALIAFAAAQAAQTGSRNVKAITDRRILAIGLLYDRMCPGGGWNCGNPRVYGVDGEALVLPTCWALLALHDTPDHPNRRSSLAWLQTTFGRIQGAASLAVARMTLESFGLTVPLGSHSLVDWSAKALAEQGTHVVSWAALALDPERRWPKRVRVASEGER